MAMRSPQRRADYYREFFTMKGICKIHTYIHTHTNALFIAQGYSVIRTFHIPVGFSLAVIVETESRPNIAEDSAALCLH